MDDTAKLLELGRRFFDMLSAKIEALEKEQEYLRAQRSIMEMDTAKLPEFGDSVVLATILSGKEDGKMKPTSIDNLRKSGVLTAAKVLDKWMFHIPTAIDEFRKHLEEQAELYEVDVA